MAYWDSKNGVIVYFEDRISPDYPAWVESDCGCCGGVKWGGESPEDCNDCAGTGHIFKHMATGTLAQWPGGPLLGKDKPIELEVSE